MSAIAREKKTSEMSRLGEVSVRRFPYYILRVRNSGSLFQSFLYAFHRGGGGEVALLRISGVSVIARCPQGESRL